MDILFGLIPHEVDLVTTVLVLAPVMIGLVAIGHWLAQLIVRTLPHILVEYRLRREVAKGKRPETLISNGSTMKHRLSCAMVAVMMDRLYRSNSP